MTLMVLAKASCCLGVLLLGFVIGHAIGDFLTDIGE